MNHLLINPRVNTAMTNKVIALHAQGYIFDFSVTADHRILCTQDERLFNLNQVIISLIDQRFDEITFCYKYIHVVETCCGDKGLLVDCRPCVNAMLEEKLVMSHSSITLSASATESRS